MEEIRDKRREFLPPSFKTFYFCARLAICNRCMKHSAKIQAATNVSVIERLFGTPIAVSGRIKKRI